MSYAQKWVILSGMAVLVLVLLFPPWQQIYRHASPYRGRLGHHLLWPPPQPVGTHSRFGTEPPSDFKVTLDVAAILRQSGSILGIVVILLLVLSWRPSGESSKARSGDAASLRPAAIVTLTTRRIALISLFLALCLPVPPPDGIPLAAIVVMAPIYFFLDTGHLAWYLPFVGGVFLAGYFTVVFLLTSGVVWVVRSRIRT